METLVRIMSLSDSVYTGVHILEPKYINIFKGGRGG